MTLRQTIQSAPDKTAELITKLTATSNGAVKTRESLFADFGEELTRYVEIKEQHLLPVLRKHPDTKDLAAGALKGTKDLRDALAKLSTMPKDNDAFLAELGELNKAFQQHLRHERNELLPAVLKALSNEEAGAIAASIEKAVADAEQAKRDAKREEVVQAVRQTEEVERAAAQAEQAKRDQQQEDAAQARRQVEEAERAEEARRAMIRAQQAAEQSAREATEKVVDTMERGAAQMQDSARQVTEKLTDRAQQVASDTREAMTVYSDSVRTFAEDLQAVRASSTTSVEAIAEVRSAWAEWLSKAVRANSEATQQLIQCKSVKQVAELQREFMTRAMHDWMESSTKVLQITHRASGQALRPLDERLSEVA